MRWRYGASNSITLLWAYLRRSAELTLSLATWRLARIISSIARRSPRLIFFK
jgi:hypothetical protein